MSSHKRIDEFQINSGEIACVTSSKNKPMSASVAAIIISSNTCLGLRSSSRGPFTKAKRIQSQNFIAGSQTIKPLFYLDCLLLILPPNPFYSDLQLGNGKGR